MYMYSVDSGYLNVCSTKGIQADILLSHSSHKRLIHLEFNQLNYPPCTGVHGHVIV